MNKELYAGQTIAKPRRWHFRMEKAHSHSAQLIQKEEKNRGKKGLYRVWREPSHARGAISPAVHAQWCANVQRCGARIQAQRAFAFAFIIAKCKSHIFFKVPQGFGLYNRASSNPPPPTAKLTNMGLTYLPSPPPGVTAVISVFWVREAFEDRAVGT